MKINTNDPDWRLVNEKEPLPQSQEITVTGTFFGKMEDVLTTIGKDDTTQINIIWRGAFYPMYGAWNDGSVPVPEQWTNDNTFFLVATHYKNIVIRSAKYDRDEDHWLDRADGVIIAPPYLGTFKWIGIPYPPKE